MAFKRAVPNQPIRISAEAHNATLDVAEAFRGGRLGSSLPQTGQSTSRIVYRILNETGEDLPPFSVVGLGDSVVEPTNDAQELLFLQQVVFRAEKPTVEKHFGRFGVTREVIKKDGFGSAVVRGPTRCRLHVPVKDEYILRAGLREDDTFSLVVHPGGMSSITWKHTDEITFRGSGAVVPDDQKRLFWADVILEGVPPGWFRFKNGNPNQCPPHGILRTTSVQKADGSEIYWEVDQPDSHMLGARIGVNGNVPVDTGKFGYMTFAGPVFVRIPDSTPAAPERGDNWGPVADQWEIEDKDSSGIASFGFEALGITIDDEGKDRRVLCWPHVPQAIKVKPVGDIDADSVDGKSSVFLDGSDSQRDLESALNWMHSNKNISSDKEALVIPFPDEDGGKGRWVFVGAECET